MIQCIPITTTARLITPDSTKVAISADENVVVVEVPSPVVVAVELTTSPVEEEELLLNPVDDVFDRPPLEEYVPVEECDTDAVLEADGDADDDRIKAVDEE